MTTPILDAFPYPWSWRVAQELHVVLCQLYPSAKGALFIAEKLGLPGYELNGDQSAFFVWKDVLEMAARAAALRGLAQLVRDQNPKSPLRKLLDALLAEPLPSATGRAVPERRLGSGDDAGDDMPSFLADDDLVGDEESLLFRDDLTLSTGGVERLIWTLTKLQALAPAVCRLKCRFGDRPGGGTGFRIAADLILTNWHVLVSARAGRCATLVTADFGYEEDSEGNERTELTVPCVIASIAGDAADDWAVVRFAPAPAAAIPIVALSEAAIAVPGAQAYVIQHPYGLPKRLGFVRNTITMCNDQVFHYLTDTQPGSSGSPVFDSQGRLIGLHHVGGRPQEVAGKPFKKNEGIRIQRVIAGLAAAGIAVP